MQPPPPPPQVQQGLTRRTAAIRIQSWTRAFISRKTYYKMYKLRNNILCYSLFIKRTFSGGQKCFIVELYKHIEGDSYYYTLRAKENKKSKSTQKQVVTQYREVRLPDDNAMLCYYMQQATVLKINPANGHITVLMLQRMRIENFKDFHCYETVLLSSKISGSASAGCIQKLEFGLSSYSNHICTVFKRIRYQSSRSKVKIKDWKIEVRQLNGARSSDYLVVRRLPCPLSELEELIQNSLGIQYNKRIVPASILHLFWEVRCITIYSQSFYDLNSLRFTTVFHSQYHFSQNPETQSRIPTSSQISESNHDPFYEIYIQKLVPKQATCDAYRYRTDAQQRRKKILREHLFGLGGKMGSLDGESSSDSEEEGDPYKYKDDQCYWDEGQLEKMQLDQDNCMKTYLKVTCSRTIDKQDQDYFKIEESSCRFAHPDIEYQYLMENLILRQVRNQNTGEININVVGLKIRNNESRFTDDKKWISSLRSINEPEMFITQDVQRWKNQNIACSIHNLKYQGGGYLVEAINVDKPHERTYMKVPSLKGMRGKVLTYYIDSCLKFFSQEDKNSGLTEKQMMNIDQTTGFGSDAIDVIAFSCGPDDFKKRMQRHVVFKNWTYEVIEDQEYEAEGDFVQDQAMQAMMSKQMEKERAAEDKKVSQELKDQRLAMQRKREEKKSQAKVSKKVGVSVSEQSSSQVVTGNLAQKIMPEGDLISKFVIKSEVTPVKTMDVEITITKFTSPVYFKIDIVNVANTLNDDKLTLKAFRLPGTLKASETDKSKIANMFKQKLRIIWQSATAVAAGQVKRMQDAFIDNSVIREEIIHKIVEVPVYPDGYQKSKRQIEPKEKKSKRSKSSESDSDFDKGKISEQDYKEIKKDVKQIKKIIKQISQKTDALQDGVAGWFKRFDTDNSDEIDLQEFIGMIQYLGIVLEDRIGIMLFRTFDRVNQGFFGQTEFIDIVDKRMIPNYKRIVYMERERFKLDGLDIQFPKRKKQEVQVIYRDKIKIKEVPKEKIVEKIVEKKVYVDKIVEKIVEVEKPTYIEKIVEKPIYIQQQPQVQYVNHQGPPPQQYNYGPPPDQYGPPLGQHQYGPPPGQYSHQQVDQHHQAPPQYQAPQQQPPQQVIHHQQTQQNTQITQQHVINQQTVHSTQQNVQNVTNQVIKTDYESEYSQSPEPVSKKQQPTQPAPASGFSQNEVKIVTDLGVRGEVIQGQMRSDIKQIAGTEIKTQYAKAETLNTEKEDAKFVLHTQVQDTYLDSKPIFEQVSQVEPLKKIQFKNQSLTKTSNAPQQLHRGVQIGFKPAQIIIQADWCDQNYGQKMSKILIQIWRGEKAQCIYEQDIFGYFDRSGKQTKMVYSASDEVVRIGQAGDWYKIFGFVAPGGPHKLDVQLFDMTIMAEFDPNRENKIQMNEQANQMASLLMTQKKGLITVDNVKIGLEIILRQDWPSKEYGKLMSFHGPRTLRGVVISYCDAQNKNYGQADATAQWHNREYLVNGRLSETHTVIVKWEKYSKLPHQSEDDRMISEQQGTYRIGHQEQYWLEVYQEIDPQRQQRVLSRAEIAKLDSELVKNAQMIFDKVDNDRSGSIDYKEFGQVMRELGHDLSSFELDNLLKQLDSDGSGRVEFEEFITHIASGLQERQAQDDFLDWDDDQNQQKNLKLQTSDVFQVQGATMSYTIFSGKNKDYYLSCETKHKNQIKILFNKVLIGDNYEEMAREQLRAKEVTNPSPGTLAKQIGDKFRDVFEQASNEVVRKEQDPEEWMEELKKKIKAQVAK